MQLVNLQPLHLQWATHCSQMSLDAVKRSITIEKRCGNHKMLLSSMQSWQLLTTLHLPQLIVETATGCQKGDFQSKLSDICEQSGWKRNPTCIYTIARFLQIGAFLAKKVPFTGRVIY